MLNRIDAEIKELVEEKWTPGIIAISGSDKESVSYIYGYIDDTHNEDYKVNDNTLVDLASVTKLFTLLLTMKMQKEKMIDIDKSISSYSAKYVNLENLKVYELMNFSKTFITAGRIDKCESREEALKLVYSSSIKSYDPQYSDIGSIILSSLIDEIYGTNAYRNLMKSVWEEYGLKRTFWWDELPVDNNCFSYDNEYRFIDSELITVHTPIRVVHDKKAQVLGACGHAGVFSCASDIILLSEKILSGDSSISDYVFLSNKYDSVDKDGRHFGLLCLKKTNNQYCEPPLDSSEYCIAMSGYTGSYYCIDFENKRYVFIGSNRLNNRLSTNVYKTELDNTQIPYIKVTKEYVYKKDTLRDTLYNGA